MIAVLLLNSNLGHGRSQILLTNGNGSFQLLKSGFINVLGSFGRCFPFLIIHTLEIGFMNFMSFLLFLFRQLFLNCLLLPHVLYLARYEELIVIKFVLIPLLFLLLSPMLLFLLSFQFFHLPLGLPLLMALMLLFDIPGFFLMIILSLMIMVVLLLLG